MAGRRPRCFPGSADCCTTLTGRWRRSVCPLDRVVDSRQPARFLIDQVADLLSVRRDREGKGMLPSADILTQQPGRLPPPVSSAMSPAWWAM